MTAKIKLAIAAAIIAAAFLSGWWVNGWRWEAKALDAERDADKARVELSKKSATIVKKESANAAKIIYKTKLVYKEVARIPDSELACTVGVRFRTIWNNTAIGETSEPTDPVQ